MTDNKTRAVSATFVKPIGSSGKFTFLSTADWMRNLRKFSIGQWSFTGNSAALPSVIYARFSLSNNDRVHMVVAPDATVPTFSSDVTVPLFAQQNGLESEMRIIATSHRESPFSLNGVSVRFDTIESTGATTEFKDFTAFVAEFEVDQQPTQGRKVQNYIGDI